MLPFAGALHAGDADVRRVIGLIQELSSAHAHVAQDVVQEHDPSQPPHFAQQHDSSVTEENSNDDREIEKVAAVWGDVAKQLHCSARVVWHALSGTTSRKAVQPVLRSVEVWARTQ